MKKGNRGVLLALAVTALVLSGCVTASAPKSANDTLLVIPVSYDRTGIGTNMTGTITAAYVLKISGISNGLVHSTVHLDPNSHYAFIQGLPPGEYDINGIEFVHEDGKVDARWPLTLLFVLAPRELTILGLDFIYHAQTVGARTYLGVKDRPLSYSEATALISTLSNEGTLSRWKLSPATERNPAVDHALRQLKTPPSSDSKSVEFASSKKG